MLVAIIVSEDESGLLLRYHVTEDIEAKADIDFEYSSWFLRKGKKKAYHKKMMDFIGEVVYRSRYRSTGNGNFYGR